jgi:hypothetical protein
MHKRLVVKSENYERKRAMDVHVYSVRSLA